MEQKTEQKYNLVVTTDLAAILPKAIESNYEVVHAELTEVLKKYEGLVVTDENFKEMKDVRAEINRGIAQIHQAGTDTKAKLLAPFLPFAEKVKTLEALAIEKRDALDKQIKEIEENRRVQKKHDIGKYFGKVCAENGFDLKNPKICAHFQEFAKGRTQWVNATCKLTKIYAEIDAEIARCKDAISQVQRIYENDLEVVKEKAKTAIVDTGYDVGAACEIVNQFKEEERRLAEARERDEARRREKEERERREKEERERQERERREREEADRQRREKERQDAEAAEKARAQIHGGQGAPVSAERPVQPTVTPAASPAAPVQPAAATISANDPLAAAKAAIRAARAENHDLPPVAEPPVAEQPKAEEPAAAPAVADMKPTIYKMGMDFTATIAQLHKLKDFMDEEGISYEVTADPVEVKENA